MNELIKTNKIKSATTVNKTQAYKYKTWNADYTVNQLTQILVNIVSK